MTGIKWSDSRYEGRLMRSLIRKLSRQAERIKPDSTGRISDSDLEKLIRIAYCLKDLALAKNKIAEIADLQQRIAELETMAGIAKKGSITP